MKIGIDARPLQNHNQFRGIGKTLEFFIKYSRADNGSNKKFIYYIDGGLPTPNLLKDTPEAQIITLPTAKLGRRKYFRSVLRSSKPIIPSQDDIGVLLQFDASLGVPTSVPTVTIFYDLIPLIFRNKTNLHRIRNFRQFRNKISDYAHWQKYVRTLKEYKKSRVIVAISKSSLDDMRHYLPELKKIDARVVSLGIAEIGQYSLASNSIKNLASKRFLLYVGGIDSRKNIMKLLQSFFNLKSENPDLRLVVVGKEFELKDQLKDIGWTNLMDANSQFSNDVISTGYINGDDLTYLYSRAEAFVFPSSYEGFGLPVLEAMQAGCPVIAYNNSSIPEVTGDAALLVKDGESLNPAIRKVINDANLRQSMIKKGKKQAEKFSLKTTVQELIDIANNVAI